VDTTYFSSIPARPARRARLAAVGVAALGLAILLGGCGQNFESDGGVNPVPRPSTEGLRRATPEANPSAPRLIGPGYAPPRSGGPTQTAVPNKPGGKY
jgi:hypothetical protein